MLKPLVACNFNHAALGRQIALEDHKAAGRLDRVVEWVDNHLPWRLLAIGCLFGKRSAGYVPALAVKQTCIE
jgi:hypothetical protein